MDISYYQAPGPYFPYMPCPFGTFVGTGVHSPTPSLCSEPFFQVPLSDGQSASQGVQMITPKMQFLNKNMIDACKRKTIPAKLQTPMLSPDMTNVFQAGVAFADQVSENWNGRMKGGSMIPQSCFTSSYRYNQSSITHQEYPMKNKTSKNAIVCCDLKHTQTAQTDAHGRCQDKPLEQQEQDYTNSIGSSRPDNRSLPKKRTPEKYAEELLTAPEEDAFHPGSRRTEAEVNCERRAERNPSTICRKKDLISFAKNVMNKDLRKQKFLAKKRRKKIQKKNELLVKTEFCTNWTLMSTCKFKERCFFAHGVQELRKRSRVSNYKTQPCIDCLIENGRCMFGSRCNYCHPGEGIRRVIGSTYYDKDYYENMRNEFANNVYPFGIFL